MIIMISCYVLIKVCYLHESSLYILYHDIDAI
jgi:hypothetical protein